MQIQESAVSKKLAGPRRWHSAILLGISLGLGPAGCATAPLDPAARAAFDEADDPLEPLNRGVFEINRVFDKALLKPVAQAYRTVFPELFRDSLRNLLENLKQPVVFANEVLQGSLARAGTTAARFTFNSTFGVAGLFDVASGWGLPAQTGDFGQTLYTWGLPPGPYLMVPMVGPTNPRDGIGMSVDGYADPFRFLANAHGVSRANLSRFLADGVDLRSRHIEDLDDIEKSSIDFYAQIRSLSRQQRAKELGVATQATPLGSTILDIYADPAAAPASGAAK
jgi:phospholipid-binding lipoprotein MlaA